MWIWGEKEAYLVPGNTVGVTNGTGAVHKDWCTMPSTPGLLNWNQTIDPDLFVQPNSGYIWITSRLMSGNISQLLGDDTGSIVTVTMAQGGDTNIVFDVDKWYQLDCKVTPDEQASVVSGPLWTNGVNRYTLSLANISNSVDVAASAVVADYVMTNVHARGKAYLPAIMNWLAKGTTGSGTPFEGSTITNALWRGSDGSGTNIIDLVGMYWLDLDPTKAGWELWGGSGTVSNIVRTSGTSGEYVRTNLMIEVWMKISNSVDTAVAPYPPYRLQGLNNEQSDKFVGNNWTSETFKVMMGVDLTKFRTMSQFIFNSDSFYGAGATDGTPFTALIEVADPNSKESPVWGHGWGYSSIFGKWTLDEKPNAGIGISPLNKQNIIGY